MADIDHRGRRRRDRGLAGEHGHHDRNRDNAKAERLQETLVLSLLRRLHGLANAAEPREYANQQAEEQNNHEKWKEDRENQRKQKKRK